MLLILIRPITVAFIVSMAIVLFYPSKVHADIISWVDENGIRHFSNIAASEKAGDVEVKKEHKYSPSKDRRPSKKTRAKALRKRLERDHQDKQNRKWNSIQKQMKRKNDALKKEWDAGRKKLVESIGKNRQPF